VNLSVFRMTTRAKEARSEAQARPSAALKFCKIQADRTRPARPFYRVPKCQRIYSHQLASESQKWLKMSPLTPFSVSGPVSRNCVNKTTPWKTLREARKEGPARDIQEFPTTSRAGGHYK